MADPKRIQVRNRFIEVMDGIRAEGGYFYTPDLVTEKIIEFYKGSGSIRLTAYPDEGGEIVNHSGAVDETFYMLVHAVIEDSVDPHKKGERVLQDVRRAIDTDARNPNTGYLGGICLQVVMDEAADMFTEISAEGHIEFMQRFRCQITGADFAGL